MNTLNLTDEECKAALQALAHVIHGDDPCSSATLRAADKLREALEEEP